MQDTFQCSGYACTDCLFYVAYGDLPTDMSEADTETWLREVNERNDGYQVVLGMPASEHNETCTEADREVGCSCEHIDFSSSSCDVCGGNLGGSRDAVSFFTV